MGETIATIKPPKIIVVDITEEPSLLQDNDTSAAQLSRFLGALLETLHDLGTLAVGIPRPWMAHGGRLYGASELSKVSWKGVGVVVLADDKR